jgi:hypothetical protein
MALLSEEIDACHALLTAAGVPRGRPEAECFAMPLSERIAMLVTRCQSLQGQLSRRTADWEQAKEICRRAERRCEELEGRLERAKKDVDRLREFEIAWNGWSDKPDWIQDGRDFPAQT